MASPVLCVEEGVNPESVIIEANGKNIDFLGYRVKGRIIGAVNRSLLEGGALVSESFERLTDEMVIPNTTSLIQTFHMLEARPFLLVNAHNGIVGIVTSPDLDKRPMRILLFSGVSELERLFLVQIKRSCDNDIHCLKEKLGDNWTDVEELYSLKRTSNRDISHFDCLNPRDMIALIGKDPHLRKLLSPTDRFEDDWGFLPTFRAQIVHPTDSYVHTDAAKLVNRWKLIIDAIRTLGG